MKNPLRAYILARQLSEYLSAAHVLHSFGEKHGAAAYLQSANDYLAKLMAEMLITSAQPEPQPEATDSVQANVPERSSERHLEEVRP